MATKDLTIEILKAIRVELQKSNNRLEHVERTLGQQLKIVSENLERLERRQVETETRLATEILGVVNAVYQVRDLLKDQGNVKNQLQDHDKRIRSLEHHLPAR